MSNFTWWIEIHSNIIYKDLEFHSNIIYKKEECPFGGSPFGGSPFGGSPFGVMLLHTLLLEVLLPELRFYILSFWRFTFWSYDLFDIQRSDNLTGCTLRSLWYATFWQLNTLYIKEIISSFQCYNDLFDIQHSDNEIRWSSEIVGSFVFFEIKWILYYTKWNHYCIT